MRPRDSNTFNSNVMANEGQGPSDGGEQWGKQPRNHITRQDKNWESQVFAGPQQNKVNRKILSRGDHGRGGLYGDKDDEYYEKRQNFAGTISQKEATKPIVFDETAAEERKIQELYGKGKYQAHKRGEYRPHTAKLDSEHDTNRKDRKMNELQSNILTHQDSKVREERNAQFHNDGKRLGMASNSAWNAQGGFSHPVNAGKVDPYRMKQNQLHSGVLEQTDYSGFEPMRKKQLDMNNIDAKPTF